MQGFKCWLGFHKWEKHEKLLVFNDDGDGGAVKQCSHCLVMEYGKDFKWPPVDPTPFPDKPANPLWEDPDSACLHNSCPRCNGTGQTPNGPCFHTLSCPCPKCTPR
jgi:hypothetical protein